jgi:hypothetical protein
MMRSAARSRSRSYRRPNDLVDSARFALLAFNSTNSDESALMDHVIAQTQALLPSMNVFKVTVVAAHDQVSDANPYRSSSPYFLLIRPDGYLITQWRPRNNEHVRAVPEQVVRGQDMNTWIHKGFNFAWNLALVSLASE